VVTKPSIVLLVPSNIFIHHKLSLLRTKGGQKQRNKKWNSSPKTNRYHVIDIVQSKSLTHLSKTHTYLIFHDVLSSMKYMINLTRKGRGLILNELLIQSLKKKSSIRNINSFEQKHTHIPSLMVLKKLNEIYDPKP
jgi:hypothetical protein